MCVCVRATRAVTGSAGLRELSLYQLRSVILYKESVMTICVQIPSGRTPRRLNFIPGA